MILKKNIIILAALTWVGMLGFLTVGSISYGSPELELECPTSVWDRIEENPDLVDEVTKSKETMRQYNCERVWEERPPFNPTPWLIFGCISGFAVGAMFLRTSHQIVSYPHHGEDEKCQWCYYSSREGAVCHCPDCVGDAYGPDYRTKVYAHGKIPLHNNEVEEAKCRVCKNRGWT